MYNKKLRKLWKVYCMILLETNISLKTKKFIVFNIHCIPIKDSIILCSMYINYNLTYNAHCIIYLNYNIK